MAYHCSGIDLLAGSKGQSPPSHPSVKNTRARVLFSSFQRFSTGFLVFFYTRNAFLLRPKLGRGSLQRFAPRPLSWWQGTCCPSLHKTPLSLFAFSLDFGPKGPMSSSLCQFQGWKIGSNNQGLRFLSFAFLFERCVHYFEY